MKLTEKLLWREGDAAVNPNHNSNGDSLFLRCAATRTYLHDMVLGLATVHISTAIWNS